MKSSYKHQFESLDFNKGYQEARKELIEELEEWNDETLTMKSFQLDKKLQSLKGE